MANLSTSQKIYNEDTQALLDLITSIVNKGELTEEDKTNIGELKTNYNESYAQVNADIDAVRNAQTVSQLSDIKNDILNIESQTNANTSNTQTALAIGEFNLLQVEQLNADFGYIDELVSKKANIVDLVATNGEIENLKSTKAEIRELDSAIGNINTLTSKVGDIETLVNGNLSSNNIQSFNITADKVTMADAFVKDAMIDSVTANKITSGSIDTNEVTITSADGSMTLTGSVQQFKDENGKVRIQIGKDGGGNFTFVLYDSTGRGVLIDEDGIKSSNAIADGLIVDSKVSNKANISGSKLNIASVINEVNNDTSTAIKSNKIHLDEQNQSLEVAFNSLKSEVNTIKDVTISGDLSSVIEQVTSNTTELNVAKEGINTLVAQNKVMNQTITNLDGEIQEVNTTLSNKYSELEQDMDGFRTTVNSMSSDLKNNYSTTSVMNSAIQQKANEITNTVSSTYVTKETFNGVESSVAEWNEAKSQLTPEGIVQTVQNVKSNSGEPLFVTGDILNGKIKEFEDDLSSILGDGVIDEMELKIIEQHLITIDREKADVDAKYSQLYNNVNLK